MNSSEIVSQMISRVATINNYLKDCYTYLKRALNTSSQKLRPSADIVLTQFGFYFTTYIVLCYLLYIGRILFRNQLSKSDYFDAFAKRILVVTAHPDDECMFFGPLIVRMVKCKKCVYLLCLCNGNVDGKGFLRKKELWLSCKKLGISPENVFLCNSSERIDGAVMWKSENIAALINDYVGIFDIDTIVTFDKLGVSGHVNHIALFKAVSFLNLRQQLPENCHIFLLDSLGFIRKYSSVMDCVLSLIFSHNVFILSPHEHVLVKQAMWMHKTQLVWYRRLYMYFTRYAYVNSLSELPRYTG